MKKILNFDFKKIDLQKLNLSKMDLNSIDVHALQEMIKEKKQLVLQVAFILISIVILISIIMHFQDQNQQNKNDIKVLEEKKVTINEYEKKLEKNTAFKKSMPQEIDEDQLSNQIMDYAQQNNCTISSISTGVKTSEKYSEGITLNVVVGVNAYKDFLNFLQDLESSSYSFRVDSCLLLPKQNVHLTEDQDQNVPLEANLSIVYTMLRK